ncbi:MAG: CBS domain-containing protein [Candidatus Methanomethyliaceae archaeon]|nr:CBS domain-containing protein [Candidatus Methanomethyliaceae archaeon]MDW7971474.1 CBS domain-containing protein [Nitrososphaerota archaeon]
MLVKDVMNSNVVYVEAPGNREQILKKFYEKKVSGFPVVKKGTRQVIGIITREDFLKHIDEEQIALIMNSNVVTITPDDELSNCIKIMLNKGYRRLPVVVNKELVGIITIGDIVHKVVSRSSSNIKVKDLMCPSIIACWHNTPLNIAGRIMILTRSNVIIALNDDEQIVGILSLTDLMKYVEIKIEEKKAVLKSGSEGQEWDWNTTSFLFITKDRIILPKIPLHQAMVTPCITIRENASINECAIKMKKHDVDQLIVVNAKNEVQGIIFDIDLLKSL